MRQVGRLATVGRISIPSVIFMIAGCGGGGSSVVVVTPQTWGSSDAGIVDGPVAVAKFANPANVAVAADGTVYVADYDNDAIRTIDPTGNVKTLTKVPNFRFPFGLVVTSTGKLYVGTDANDSGNKDSSSGTVWQIDLGTGTPTVVLANLGRPRGLSETADGRIVVSDLIRNNLSVFDPVSKSLTALAGSTAGTAGFADGIGGSAMFSRPYGLSRMPDGSFLVADQTNNRIRRVTLDGKVSTFAGLTASGQTDGPTATATLNGPESVSVSPDGTAYVADTFNHVVRRIKAGQMITICGNGKQGYVDSPGLAAEFYGLEGLALSPNGRSLIVADGNGGDGTDFNRVRRVPIP